MTSNAQLMMQEERLCGLQGDYHFSAGAVQWRSGESSKDIFDRGDHGMYQIKESGKNGILFCD